MLSTIGIAFIAIVALVIGLFSGGAVNLRRVNAGAAIIGPGIGLVAALTLATIPGALTYVGVFVAAFLGGILIRNAS
jgi:hypothetical protein